MTFKNDIKRIQDLSKKPKLVQGCPNFGGGNEDGPEPLAPFPKYESAEDAQKRVMGWADKIVAPEPMPVKNQHPFMWDYAIEEFTKVAKARDKFGFEKYGTRLQPFNGRDALTDGFQENVDAIVYLFQQMYENQFTKPVVEAAIQWSEGYNNLVNPTQADKDLFAVITRLKEAMGQ